MSLSDLASLSKVMELPDWSVEYGQPCISHKGDVRYNITEGVPQESVLGPLLWNVMYDGILRLKLSANAEIIGIADDIAIVLVAETIPQIAALSSS